VTKFFVRNLRPEGDGKFRPVSREIYKSTARGNNKINAHPIRVETSYIDGEPVKRLSMLPNSAS